MSKDLTQKLNSSIEDKIDWLITAVQSMDSRMVTRLEGIETRLGTIETRLDNVETRIENLETRIENLETRIENLETLIENLETRIENLETRVGNVETRLESLEIKVDERMKETRPMWESVQTQLTELSESQEKGFRRFDRAMDLVAGDRARLHGDHVELESRVYKIEKRLNT
jgi:chromosome segregation ATPase